MPVLIRVAATLFVAAVALPLLAAPASAAPDRTLCEEEIIDPDGFFSDHAAGSLWEAAMMFAARDDVQVHVLMTKDPDGVGLDELVTEWVATCDGWTDDDGVLLANLLLIAMTSDTTDQVETYYGADLVPFYDDHVDRVNDQTMGAVIAEAGWDTEFAIAVADALAEYDWLIEGGETVFERPPTNPYIVLGSRHVAAIESNSRTSEPTPTSEQDTPAAAPSGTSGGLLPGVAVLALAVGAAGGFVAGRRRTAETSPPQPTDG